MDPNDPDSEEIEALPGDEDNVAPKGTRALRTSAPTTNRSKSIDLMRIECRQQLQIRSGSEDQF